MLAMAHVRLFCPVVEVSHCSRLAATPFVLRCPPRLVRYTRVKRWEDGYLEVGVDYGSGVAVKMLPFKTCKILIRKGRKDLNHGIHRIHEKKIADF